ncbi:uncharacterized protein Z518_02757 [Rhinocladiella mackenziei CBS 650.93]|uniref:CCZ1/INTU/HSP4 first Longin domain-containing protein n=1 Tax=Rhinocladiella mackenziei CBS 650.93 TaxID=1442369 RepID=A0A0D2G0R9_9EURO|nr:uncharacterized protein Z518_02757 [Rhinocladiella mackenziei CBS 650.93]KIX08102.1 hypothetical protein Z518_02757 [Rhinocladiella mackenziei CBS 650.93]
MSSGSSHLRVVPAHLSYLAIYNPSLGPTDETVRDQIVFYYSKKLEDERERRRKQRASGSGKRNELSKHDQQRDSDTKEEGESEEHERLRQVGLAQGMVDFVNNFSNGAPLESIETEKSRVVLKEVEPQWWILAAIDLTKLPSTNSGASTTKKSTSSTKDTGSASTENVEFSSREVAPAPLLLAQLTQAHRGFLLHHASCLAELWKKHENNKELFCSMLSRYWTRFIWNWDVLLHGNPAVELYDAVKLAGGGELGIGVGEEEWGSGEREVLEEFVSRTEGLLDLVVGRYGDAPMAQVDGKQGTEAKVSEVSQDPEPWLGNGEDSRAQDGIIFSGVGGISRRSLAAISQWMDAIYVQGEAAYGVSENPASPPRKHRRKRKPGKDGSSRPRLDRTRQQQRDEVQLRTGSPRGTTPYLRRKAIENNATPRGIPAPLVSAVERSLNDVTAKANGKGPTQKDEDAGESTSAQSQKDQEQSSTFGAEKMMKYLSLGYGTSWTLNPKGFSTDKISQETPKEFEPYKDEDHVEGTPAAEEQLPELDPTPEVSDEEEQPFVQRLEQSIGRFLIGLSGDLENAEFEDEANDETTDRGSEVNENEEAASSASTKISNRIFLRTLVMEMSPSRFSKLSTVDNTLPQPSVFNSETPSSKGNTSAAATADGSRPAVTNEKVQVAVYVHQPFIFVFLFQLQTPNLTVPGFYRAIHHTLGPLQKSLLRSTDPERWRERVKETLQPGSNSFPNREPSPAAVLGSKSLLEIYDLVYDPSKGTIRTSIPNIPLPGSLAAEGLHRAQQQLRPITVSGSWYTLGIPIGSSSSSTSPSGGSTLVKSEWTRIEALNVHAHILNIWATTREQRVGTGRSRQGNAELERTVKTARGWWIVWMRALSPRGKHGGANNETGEKQTSQNWSTYHSDCDKSDCQTNGMVATEAILVRRSPQHHASSGRETSRSRSDSRRAGSAGRWLLREQPRNREVSGTGYGNGASSGTTNAKDVSEGVGVDARKWVEGLIRLSM